MGAVLTTLYTFRMVFIASFGASQAHVARVPTIAVKPPLFVLAVGSMLIGFVELSGRLVDKTWFDDSLQSATLPEVNPVRGRTGSEAIFELVAAVLALATIYAAYSVFLSRPSVNASLNRTKWGAALQTLWFVGWGFDGLIRPALRPPIRGSPVSIAVTLPTSSRMTGIIRDKGDMAAIPGENVVAATY